MNKKKKSMNKAKVSEGHGLKCQDCGKISSDVEHTTCPFTEDVYGEIVDCVLCPACFDERLMEI